MSKIILYSAASVDGYIAGPDGEIDWLFDDGNDYGYHEFNKTIDCAIMGQKTYDLMLSFGVDCYEGIRNVVFSRTKKKSDKVEYVTENIPEFCKQLKSESKKNVWLVGGCQINSILLENDLIDEMQISYHPIVIGSGIPLFKSKYLPKTFKTVGIEKYDSGLFQVRLTKSG